MVDPSLNFKRERVCFGLQERPKTRFFDKNVTTKDDRMWFSVLVLPLQFQLVLFTDVLASLPVLKRFISDLECPEVVAFCNNDG